MLFIRRSQYRCKLNNRSTVLSIYSNANVYVYDNYLSSEQSTDEQGLDQYKQGTIQLKL